MLQMGLFSAAAAALLTVTVQDLKQDFQETSAFYLENIYKLQAGDSNASLPFTPAQPPQFTAPRHAIWVNALLFASLCLDIFAAILAMMIREEISERLRITESPRYSPQSRARLREIIVSEFKTFPYMTIGLMLVVSGCFFFIGLSVYLFHISRAVFGAFVCFACLGCIAFTVIASWLEDVSVCSFVMYMRIKHNSSFIRRVSLGRNRQQGPTTSCWTDYSRPSSRIPTLCNTLRASLAFVDH
jgi:Family of unknown function (DUF6535)